MNDGALAGCPVEVREAGEEAFDSASRLSLQPSSWKQRCQQSVVF